MTEKADSLNAVGFALCNVFGIFAELVSCMDKAVKLVKFDLYADGK